MSKDYHGEVAKFPELVWFRIPAEQPKLAEQWREAHWVGKSERSDEHLLAIRGSTYPARAIRKKPRDEQWNLESVKAVLVSPWELRVRSEFDASVTRQKYITNQMLDQYGRTPLCTRCPLGTGSRSSDCRARFESIWTEELAEAEVPIRAEAEVEHRAVDAVANDPNVRVSEPLEPAAAGDQLAAMEVNTDPVVERACGASPWPGVSQAQPMDVSLEQRVTTGATKRAAEIQLTPNSVEGYIGGLRSFDGHQDVQTNVMSAI